MKEDIDITEASIYVGTYAKYNSGSIYGRWLRLSDYEDIEAFYKACAALHADEEDPEYMFQDHEHIPHSLISESWLSEKFFEVRDAVAKMNKEEIEPFSLWCCNGHYDLSKEDIDDLVTSFRNDYQGPYSSESDFAYEYVSERYDLSEFVRQYFDYERFAKDLFITDYWYMDGYVFRDT